MTGLLVLEVRRALRDLRYLLIAVCMPVGLYLLFSGLFGRHGERADGLPQPVELMVAMVAYGAMWAVLSATGPRIANERAIGWSQQLRLTPLGEAAAVGVKLLAALLVALPAMILVCVTAALSHHVRLSATEWAAMLTVMWLGTTPLALLGMAIGRFVNADAAFGISMALYFLLGALGGLWMPLSTMPHVMRQIAKFLPSNGVAELGWRAVGGDGTIGWSVVVLAAWSAACGVLALCRRSVWFPPLEGSSKDRDQDDLDQPVSKSSSGPIPRTSAVMARPREGTVARSGVRSVLARLRGCNIGVYHDADAELTATLHRRRRGRARPV